MFNAVASSLSPSLVTSAQTCVTFLVLSPWDFKSDVCKNPCPYPQTLSQRSSILVYRCSFKKRSTQLVQGKSVVQSIAIASAQVPKLNLLPLCESAVTSLWINAAPVLISYSVMSVFTLICVLILKPDAMGLNWARCTLSSSSSPSWYFWTPGFMAILSLNHDNDTLKLVSFLGLDPAVICYQVYCLIPWQVSFQKTKWMQPSQSSFFFWKL